MVQYEVMGGVDTFALYKKESVFGVNPGNWGTDAKHFGIETSIKPNITRGLKKVRGLSGCLPSSYDEKTSRDAQQIFGQKVEFSASIDFEVQDFAFMEFVFGSMSDTAGGSPYYYPQETAVSIADKRKYIRPNSFSLMTRFDFGGVGDNADKVWVYSGIAVNSCSMKAAMDEAVTVTLDCVGLSMIGDSVDIPTNYPCAPNSAEEVYNFAHAHATYGGAPIENIIEGFDFTLENSAEALYGLGDYNGKKIVWKERNVKVSFDLTAEGTQFMDDMMGSSTTIQNPTVIDTVELLLEKSPTKTTTVVLKNLRMPGHSLELTYGEVTKEKVELEAEFCYILENR